MHGLVIPSLLVEVNQCDVDGYLGNVECEDSKDNFDYYLSGNLIIDVEGYKADRIVEELINDMLKFCEQLVKSDLYEAIKEDPTVRTKRETLRLFYQRMIVKKVKVTNPKLTIYDYLLTWLNAALRSKLWESHGK